VFDVATDAILVPPEGVILINLQLSEPSAGDPALIVGIITDIFSSPEFFFKEHNVLRKS
jgi:hypothetical protein